LKGLETSLKVSLDGSDLPNPSLGSLDFLLQVLKLSGAGAFESVDLVLELAENFVLLPQNGSGLLLQDLSEQRHCDSVVLSDPSALAWGTLGIAPVSSSTCVLNPVGLHVIRLCGLVGLPDRQVVLPSSDVVDLDRVGVLPRRGSSCHSLYEHKVPAPG
jgi:hypothetical protein